MKELKNKSEDAKEESLYEQAMRARPKFATTEQAVDFYTKKLNALAEKRQTTVPKLLTEAENSSSFEEDYLEASHLWMTLSSLRSLKK
jgi:hypothetical protein